MESGFVVVIRKLLRPIRMRYRIYKSRKLAEGKTKYFVIGRNKTGTTSLKKAFEEFGFPVGDPLTAEILAHEGYFMNDFKSIIEYCESAQVFQDIPFSWPETYKYIDRAYPNSKFILTVRDDSEQWYKSISRFHTNKFGSNGMIPTAKDLEQAKHKIPGFMTNTIKIHGTPYNNPYDKGIMIAHYEKHNQDVKEYFMERPDDLLVINISNKEDYKLFCSFICVKSNNESFPWENKT